MEYGEGAEYVEGQFRSTRDADTVFGPPRRDLGRHGHQLEHHLFPTMPRYNYHRLRPILQAWAKANDINYRISPSTKIISTPPRPPSPARRRRALTRSALFFILKPCFTTGTDIRLYANAFEACLNITIGNTQQRAAVSRPARGPPRRRRARRLARAPDRTARAPRWLESADARGSSAPPPRPAPVARRPPPRGDRRPRREGEPSPRDAKTRPPGEASRGATRRARASTRRRRRAVSRVRRGLRVSAADNRRSTQKTCRRGGAHLLRGGARHSDPKFSFIPN